MCCFYCNLLEKNDFFIQLHIPLYPSLVPSKRCPHEKLSQSCHAGTINALSLVCVSRFLSAPSYFPHFFDVDLFRERRLDFFQHFEADLLRERLLDLLPRFFEADLLQERLINFMPLFLEADLLRERLIDFMPLFLEADLCGSGSLISCRSSWKQT